MISTLGAAMILWKMFSLGIVKTTRNWQDFHCRGWAGSDPRARGPDGRGGARLHHNRSASADCRTKIDCQFDLISCLSEDCRSFDTYYCTTGLQAHIVISEKRSFYLFLKVLINVHFHSRLCPADQYCKFPHVKCKITNRVLSDLRFIFHNQCRWTGGKKDH